MTVLGKLWRGEYALPVAFWGFYCGGLLVCMLLYILVFVAARLVFYATLILNPEPVSLVVCWVLLFAYFAMATIGVWRSASRYWTSPIWMQRIWAAVARAVVALYFASAMARLIDGGALGLVQRIAGDTGF